MILPFPKLYLYAGIALAILLAVGIIYKRGVDSGKAAQKEEMVADAKTELEAERAKAEERFRELRAEVKEEREAARVERQEARTTLNRLVTANAELASKRQSDLQEVAKIAPSDRRAAIIGKIGERQAQDGPACYTPSEELVILNALTDLPNCKKSEANLSQQILSKSADIQALERDLRAVEKDVAAEKKLREDFSGFYVRAYNLLRQKKRSPKCLWLFRCGREPLLNLPSPDTLAKTETPNR